MYVSCVVTQPCLPYMNMPRSQTQRSSMRIAYCHLNLLFLSKGTHTHRIRHTKLAIIQWSDWRHIFRRVTKQQLAVALPASIHWITKPAHSDHRVSPSSFHRWPIDSPRKYLRTSRNILFTSGNISLFGNKFLVSGSAKVCVRLWLLEYGSFRQQYWSDLVARVTT